ncbi:hypothetical protein T02_3491 [Trichinella nativa]|uniref:Uncharacterized protein n=1 Tax=Trichinella nativa TaxID=6335 RepID=A0A0V1LAB7_9BILA|nr:hypothetical protein T02_3491 [Trichinella nativa]
MEKSTTDKLSTAAVLSYVADIDFHLKFRFLIFFYWSRVTDSLVISFNVEHRVRLALLRES